MSSKEVMLIKKCLATHNGLHGIIDRNVDER